MTDRITAALEAADKATPGPWAVVEDIFLIQPDIQDGNGRSVATVRLPYPMNEVTRSSNATLIAAAPDMAAEIVKLRKWQSEAVEWVQQAATDRSSLIKTWRELKFTELIPDIEKDIINLDRLIAEAKEQGE